VVVASEPDAEPIPLLRRSQRRFECQEAKRQRNVEAVVMEVAAAMGSEVSHDPVDKDWTARLFTHIRVDAPKTMLMSAHKLTGVGVELASVIRVQSDRGCIRRLVKFLRTQECEARAHTPPITPRQGDLVRYYEVPLDLWAGAM
jgi:hypothetical protein